MSPWSVDFKRLTLLAGWWGALILATCCTLPAIAYRGREGFSFLNHFMSELGRYGPASPLAVVYNSGLFVGGALFVLFIFGCRWHFRSRMGLAAALCGILSALACSLLGFFTLNRLVSHLMVAYIFFFSWPVTVGLFTRLICLEQRTSWSRPLIMLGCTSFVLFVIFLALPFVIGLKNIWAIDLRHYARPDFLFPAVLEWAMFFSVIAWIMLVCVDLAGRQRSRTGNAAVSGSSLHNMRPIWPVNQR